MHHANADRSIRLRRALDFVKSAGMAGCTTAELQSWTQSMAPATDISELRQSGYLIDCQRTATTKSGRKVYTYTYKGKDACTMSGKKPSDPENRRTRKIASYVTEQEEIAVNKLVEGGAYAGVADAIRKGLALLITTKHPDLKDLLKKDLTTL